MNDPPATLRIRVDENNTSTEQSYIPSDAGSSQAPYFGNFNGYLASALGFEVQGPRDQYDDHANAFHQYQVPNIGTDPERTFSRDARYPDTAPRFVDRNQAHSPRVGQNYDEVSLPDARNLEGGRGLALTGADCQYNSLPSSITPHSIVSPAPMQHSPYSSSGNGQRSVEPVRSSPYRPFRASFSTPDTAREYRKAATRFNRQPYRPPESDITISEIEANRGYHVERIYNAMTRTDAAKDNPGSIAMKRWVHSAYYESTLVESYAYKVLDCLVMQAREGFRGWSHNDYVADDRKGEDEDKDVSCAARLENIIHSLEEEKTICEDVMNSACQIRMFVNAPKAYANRKCQNRVGNSKRGRPKATIDSRSSKSRRTNMRTTRARAGSSVSAGLDAQYTSPTPEPFYEHPHIQPRYATPLMHPNPSSVQIPHSLVPQLHPAVMSPLPVPSNYVQHVPRLPSMPPPQHSPSISPPVQNLAYYSAPSMLSDAQTHDVKEFPAVHTLPACSSSPQPGPPIDPIFDVISWPPELHSSIQLAGTGDTFDQSLPTSIDGNEDLSCDFKSYWEEQEGVQPFPFNEPPM